MKPGSGWRGAPLAGVLLLTVVIGACGTVKSASKLSDKPLKVAGTAVVEGVVADQEIKAACQKALVLVDEIRKLVYERGAEWEVSSERLRTILDTSASLYRRLYRLSRGGVGTAVAAAYNLPVIVSAVEGLYELARTRPRRATAGQLARAAGIEVAGKKKDLEVGTVAEIAFPPAGPPSFDTPAQELKRSLLELFSRDRAVVQQAVVRLARGRDFRSIEVLEKLARGREGWLRMLAIGALGSFADYGASRSLAAVLRSAERSDAERLAALESLSRQGTVDAADAIYDSLDLLSGEVLDRAKEALQYRYHGRLAFYEALFSGDTTILSEQMQDAELAALLVELFRRDVASRRLKAVQGLARLGDERAVPVLEALAREGGAIAHAAVKALGGIDTPRSSHVLYDLAYSGLTGIDLRRACIEALLQHRSALAASLLVDLVRYRPSLLDKEGLKQRVQQFVSNYLPKRAMVRFAKEPARNEELDVELLLDTMQERSGALRRQAVELSLRSGAGILPALEPLLEDPSWAESILPALENHPDPRARSMLAQYALDRKKPRELRMLALDSAVFLQGGDSPEEMAYLHSRLEGDPLAPKLRLLLSKYHPEQARSLGLFTEHRPPPDRGGVVPLAIGLALHGAAGMTMLSFTGEPPSGAMVALPVLGGSILGVGSSLLLTWKEPELTASQAVYVNTAGLWALYEAGTLGMALASGQSGGDLRAVGLSLGFLSQVGGLTFGWLTRESLGRGWGQQGFMNLSLVAGSMAGVGAAMLSGEVGLSQVGGGMFAGGLAGLVLSGTAGRTLRFHGSDYLQTLNSTFLGGWLGYSVGAAATAEGGSAETIGASMLGAALGFATGSVVSAYTHPPPAAIAALDGVFVAGTLAGLGAAWQDDDSSFRAKNLWMLGGGIGLTAAAGLAAPHIRIEGNDGWQIASSALMGMGTGYLLARAVQPDAEMAPWGGLLIGNAVGLGLGLGLSGVTDPGPAQLSLAGLSYVAGGLLGLGVVLERPEQPPPERDTCLWMMGGSLLGVAATYAGIGRELELSGPDKLAIATLAGLGAWSGFWGLHAFREGHETADWGGLLLGGSLGYAAGVAVAATAETSYSAISGGALGFGLGTALGLGTGLSIPQLDEKYVYTAMLGGGLAGVGAALALGDSVDIEAKDAALLSFGAAWGLYQGLGSWAAAGAENPARLATGAALLGTAGGSLAAGALAQFVDVPPAVVGRSTMGGVFGSLIGGGLGLMIPALEEQGPWALALSGGWAGLGLYAFSVPPADYTGGDYLALALGGGWGLWQGYLIGTAAQAGSKALYGSMTMGLGLGLVAGDIFARAADLEIAEVLFTELASYGGSGLGAGAALVATESGATGVAIAGSVTGWGVKALTGFFADRMKFRTDDIWEYLFLQGWGAWQGAGFSLLGSASEREIQGGTLLGVSAGLLVPMVTNQLQDFSFVEDLFIAGGAAIGSWIGVWGAYALGGGNDELLLGALLAGDAGLVLAGALMSDMVGASTWAAGWTELTAIGGLGLGASLTAIFSRDNRVLAGGMTAGTVAGVVAGMIWTSLVDEPSGGGEATSGGPSGKSTPEGGGGGNTSRGPAGFLPSWVVPTVMVVPPPATRPDAPPAMVVALQGIFG